jgi:hypothetical protein
MKGALPDPTIVFTRPGVATDSVHTDAAGTAVVTTSDGLPRLTNRGFLTDYAHRNQLLNAATPITRTTGSLSNGVYTLWVNGTGSATTSAGTATASGYGTATNGVPNIITVTNAGTVTVTVTGSLNRYQLEAGTGPTSTFIPTTASAVTRGTEVMTIPVGTWFRAGAATVVVTALQWQTIGSAIALASLDAAATNFTRLYVTAGNALAMGDVPSGMAMVIGTPTVNARFRVGMAVKDGLQLGCLNGGAVAADTNATLASSIVNLSIGSTLGSSQFVGWIQSVLVWPFAMSRSQLKAATRIH